MSEHYQQLPTPAAWSALEANHKQNQNQPSNNSPQNDSRPPPQQQQTPETTRRLLFQPMKNSRSSIEGTSPPKHFEARPGSSMLVTSQYESKESSTPYSPAPQPTPPAKQDHYQDFSLIARDPPPSTSPTHSGQSIPATQSPSLQKAEYQSLPTVQRNRTATSYTTHTSPSSLVSPPPKSAHNSDSSPAIHYQAMNPLVSSATAPPAVEHTNPRSHYMAVPDFTKFQKSESFAGPPVPPRRTHAATVAETRKVETVASDSVLYTHRSPKTTEHESFVAPSQRDEYQKIPTKEEMQSMILQKRNAQNAQNQQKAQPQQSTPSSPSPAPSSTTSSAPATPTPSPTPAPTPAENKEATNDNEKAQQETVSQTQEGKAEDPADKPIMEGLLGKKGDVGVIKAWKRRWFVLRLDLLVYYKSKEDREGGTVIGYVPLCDASAVYPSSNAPTNTAFQIDTKERVWYLRADTKAEMEQWIDACKANCNIKELTTPQDEVQKRQSMVAIARNQTLTKEGDLEKLHGTTFRMRKVLVKSGILYKYMSKTDPQPSKVTLFKCAIDDEVPEHGPLAFRVATESKTFTFRASSDKEKEDWLELLMKHKLLTETIINPQ